MDRSILSRLKDGQTGNGHHDPKPLPKISPFEITGYFRTLNSDVNAMRLPSAILASPEIQLIFDSGFEKFVPVSFAGHTTPCARVAVPTVRLTSRRPSPLEQPLAR